MNINKEIAAARLLYLHMLSQIRINLSHWERPPAACGRQRTRKTNLQGLLVPNIAHMHRLAVGQDGGSLLQQHQPRPQDGHHLHCSRSANMQVHAPLAPTGL